MKNIITWLKSEITREPDRIAVWTLVTAIAIAMAHGWIK